MTTASSQQPASNGPDGSGQCRRDSPMLGNWQTAGRPPRRRAISLDSSLSGRVMYLREHNGPRPMASIQSAASPFSNATPIKATGSTALTTNLAVACRPSLGTTRAESVPPSEINNKERRLLERLQTATQERGLSSSSASSTGNNHHHHHRGSASGSSSSAYAAFGSSNSLAKRRRRRGREREGQLGKVRMIKIVTRVRTGPSKSGGTQIGPSQGRRAAAHSDFPKWEITTDGGNRAFGAAEEEEAAAARHQRRHSFVGFNCKPVISLTGKCADRNGRSPPAAAPCCASSPSSSSSSSSFVPSADQVFFRPLLIQGGRPCASPTLAVAGPKVSAAAALLPVAFVSFSPNIDSLSIDDWLQAAIIGQKQSPKSHAPDGERDEAKGGPLPSDANLSAADPEAEDEAAFSPPALLSDCPIPPPPRSYVCRLCRIPGHWIDQCAKFQPRPSRKDKENFAGHNGNGHSDPSPCQRPVMVYRKPVPATYLCNLCRKPGHWMQQCKLFVPHPIVRRAQLQ